MMMACGEMSTSGKRVSKSTHLAKDSAATMETKAVNKDDNPMIVGVDGPEMVRVFEEAAQVLGDFVYSHTGPHIIGLVWKSELKEDKEFPHIRLSEPLGGNGLDNQYMIIEQRPVVSSKKGEVMGYTVGYDLTSDGAREYFVEWAKYMNGKEVESHRQPITSSIQMRVVLVPFYERIWQATLVKEKESHQQIDGVLNKYKRVTLF